MRVQEQSQVASGSCGVRALVDWRLEPAPQTTRPNCPGQCALLARIWQNLQAQLQNPQTGTTEQIATNDKIVVSKSWKHEPKKQPARTPNLSQTQQFATVAEMAAWEHCSRYLWSFGRTSLADVSFADRNSHQIRRIAYMTSDWVAQSMCCKGRACGNKYRHRVSADTYLKVICDLRSRRPAVAKKEKILRTW